MNFSRFSFSKSWRAICLDFQLLCLGQLGLRPGEDVENGQLVLVQTLLEVALFLLVERPGEGGQFLEQASTSRLPAL